MITGTMTVGSEDARRTIRGLNSVDGGFDFQHFTLHQGNLPLGKHGHRFRQEAFTILAGGGFVLVAKIDTNGQILEPPKRIDLEPGSVIRFGRLEGHTFYLDPGTEMICFADQPFFPEDMDFVQCPDLVIEKHQELAV